MIFSQTPSEHAIINITNAIQTELEKDMKVLWLVSGGSATLIQTRIMQKLHDIVDDNTLTHLTILPVDERFGPYGHPDSNSEQMRLAGFNPGTATWIDILNHGTTMDSVLEEYKKIAERSFAESNIVIATLGLGPDGHTAGILPDSPAVSNDTASVIGYDWKDYARMTLGVALIKQINTAFVLAYGDTKCPALQRLYENQDALSSLPAKVLYDIPTVTVYNDFIESEG